MNNKATGSTMNKACQLCKTVHDDAELTIIYDTIYACKACVANPNLAKVAKIILSTSYRDERTAVVVCFLESQAEEIERLGVMVEKGDFIAERYLALNEQAKQDAATIAKLKDELFELEAESFASEQTIDELTQQIEELKAAPDYKMRAA